MGCSRTGEAGAVVRDALPSHDGVCAHEVSGSGAV